MRLLNFGGIAVVIQNDSTNYLEDKKEILCPLCAGPMHSEILCEKENHFLMVCATGCGSWINEELEKIMRKMLVKMNNELPTADVTTLPVGIMRSRRR